MAEALGEEIAEVDAPGADGFAGDADAPFQERFFNVAVTQGKPVVEPHGRIDHREGKPVARELVAA